MERQNLVDLAAHHFAFRAEAHRDWLAGTQAAAGHAAHADTANILVIVERRDLQLQRTLRIGRTNRHKFEDRFEQRLHRAFARLRVGTRIAIQRRRVHHREVQLLFGRAELVEQIEGLVDHPFGARARTVDLVDHDNGLQTQGQRLSRHETGLRHRTFDRIDQQQHRVDHRQHALDFTAEVRVARRVDDIDMGTFVFDRAVLCENRDAAFFFDVVRVHHALGDLLVFSERAGLAKQLIDEGGLAVVDVGDDGDIA